MSEIDIKVILVGDSAVGKTSILKNYTENFFPEHHQSTVGIDYKIKKFIMRDFKIKMQIWDTAGQERFRSVTKKYFRDANGILFVFDLANRKSFENIKLWMKEPESVNGNFKKLLLGNKCDLKDIRAVDKEELDNFSKENNIEIIETSAKVNINISKSFERIVELIFEGKTDEQIKELYEIQSTTELGSILSNKQNTKNMKRNSNAKCC